MNYKKGNSLVVVLTISLVASLFLAGYFFLKTQKLEGESGVDQNKMEVKTSPTPIISITPVVQDEMKDWTDYTNKKYGFSFKYPTAVYTSYEDTGGEARNFDGTVNLASLKHIDNTSSLQINFDSHQFSLEYLKGHAPTGSEDFIPAQQVIGTNNFYYYGAGGGGVSYPDQYFYNLNGKILIFIFKGPYENDKTPSPKAKDLEKKILSTFKFL